jgi:hypothetical protein
METSSPAPSGFTGYLLPWPMGGLYCFSRFCLLYSLVVVVLGAAWYYVKQKSIMMEMNQKHLSRLLMISLGELVFIRFLSDCYKPKQFQPSL